MTPIFVQCAGCDGSGRKHERRTSYDRDCGWFDDDLDLGACDYCHGFGSEEIEGEPLTLDDLQDH